MKKSKQGKEKRRDEIGSHSIENEILIQASRLSDVLLRDINKLLSIWGMTALQYNALQVLYIYADAAAGGLPSGELGRHLYTRVTDVTRLLDRMEEKGWISRQRDPDNRRIVRAKLTDIGAQLVESAFSSLKELEEEQLSHMSDTEKTELLHLLKLAQGDNSFVGEKA